VSEKQVNQLLSAFFVMEVNIQAPMNQPTTLLKSKKRICFFLFSIRFIFKINKRPNKLNQLRFCQSIL